MDFKVTKLDVPPVPEGFVGPPVPPPGFIITYTKTIKDVNDKNVTVVDHEEHVYLAQLVSQKASLQASLDEIDKKIAAINAATPKVKAVKKVKK